MNKTIVAGVAGIAVAGALAIPAGVGVGVGGVHRDVSLTGAEDGLASGLQSLYMGLNEVLGPPGGVLEFGTAEIDHFLDPKDDFLTLALNSQLGAFMPSGLLDADVTGATSDTQSGLSAALESGLAPSTLLGGDQPWTIDLADALHSDSAGTDFTAVAGLLPNGVNVLFDQLAVDGLALSGDDTVSPIFTDAGLGGLIDHFDSSLVGLTGTEGDLAATFSDLLGVL